VRQPEPGAGLGRWRWVVERTFAWLNQFQRLRVRSEKRADIHRAFPSLRRFVIFGGVGGLVAGALYFDNRPHSMINDL
jgi:transposase